MLLLSALLIGGIIFLLTFFIALCGESKRPHCAIKVYYIGTTDIPAVTRIEPTIRIETGSVTTSDVAKILKWEPTHKI